MSTHVLAAWYEAANGDQRWSLRSRGDVDVAAIAARFGGGGHRAAAGFVVTGANAELTAGQYHPR